MTQFRHGAYWTGLALALLVSPAIVVFAVPFGYGICSDLVATTWLAPAALTLAALIGVNAVRRSAVRAQLAEVETVSAQAAKSIT